MLSLAALGLLQNAIQYDTQVLKMGMAGKESNCSATVQSRFTKLYVDVHADLVYCHTGYDVTCYFRSVGNYRCPLGRLPVEV